MVSERKKAQLKKSEAKAEELQKRIAEEEAGKPKEMSSAYNVYDISITFLEQGIAGTRQMSGSVRHDYMEHVKSETSNFLKQALKEAGVVTEDAMEKYLESTAVVLPLDEVGFYIEPVPMVISLLLNAATRTKLTVVRKGAKSTLVQTSYVLPRKLYLTNGRLDLSPVKLLERESFIPPQGGFGKSIVKSFQVLTGIAPIEFKLYSLNNGDITSEEMKRLWVVAQEIGLGGSRRLGYGKFKLNKCELMA